MSKTFHFPLPSDLRRRLEAESDRTGAPLAEVARRALDTYLKSRESSEKERESVACSNSQ
jgi:predicted DNA-binding protein